MCQAYNQRDKDRWYRTAWLAAVVLNPFVKGRVRPKRLLGWNTDLTGLSKAEVKEYHREKYGDMLELKEDGDVDNGRNAVGQATG